MHVYDSADQILILCTIIVAFEFELLFTFDNIRYIKIGRIIYIYIYILLATYYLFLVYIYSNMFY